MSALIAMTLWLVSLGALAGTTANRLKTLRLQSNALKELRELTHSRN